MSVHAQQATRKRRADFHHNFEPPRTACASHVNMYTYGIILLLCRNATRTCASSRNVIMVSGFISPRHKRWSITQLTAVCYTEQYFFLTLDTHFLYISTCTEDTIITLIVLLRCSLISHSDLKYYSEQTTPS